jgi:hypothetical protein
MAPKVQWADMTDDDPPDDEPTTISKHGIKIKKNPPQFRDKSIEPIEVKKK